MLYNVKHMASLTDLRLRDVLTTRNGSKIASIKLGEEDLVYQPDEYLRVPFEPSAFDKFETERLNLVIETTRPILEEFERLDEALIAYIAEHSDRILKKRLTVEQVRANYSSCLRTSEKGYPATVKTKVDVGSGKHAVLCWDADGNQVELPESWRKYRVIPRLHVTHLWIMGTSFGPVVRLTDALLQPDEVSVDRKNPFFSRNAEATCGDPLALPQAS